MPNEYLAERRIQITTDVRCTAMLHRLMMTGIYHARLSQVELENARRGQEMLENVLLQSGYYSSAELRMVLDSVGRIVTVAP